MSRPTSDLQGSRSGAKTCGNGAGETPGGDRWRWESRIFGAAYDAEPAHKRPVYGGLNFRRRLVGAAPRFGSSHFRLTGAALRRATFCHPDSAAEPSAFGVAAGMSLIELAEADEQDALDDYIEAQVHGPVDLARDMEALVLDASYRGTAVEAAARRLPCPVEWHPGYRLPVEELRRHPRARPWAATLQWSPCWRPRPAPAGARTPESAPATCTRSSPATPSSPASSPAGRPSGSTPARRS
ncbi:DUF3626 domain-containing protein [Streptomyces sp. NPDC059697]|uniref:DUF3626 domain-containing protein n=1 Tax=Streptomyces sp. NPDC059697 TaxID=3346912 RepID=UPI00367DF7EA